MILGYHAIILPVFQSCCRSNNSQCMRVHRKKCLELYSVQQLANQVAEEPQEINEWS